MRKTQHISKMAQNGSVRACVNIMQADIRALQIFGEINAQIRMRARERMQRAHAHTKNTHAHAHAQ